MLRLNYCLLWMQVFHDFVLYKRCLVGLKSASVVYKLHLALTFKR